MSEHDNRVADTERLLLINRNSLVAGYNMHWAPGELEELLDPDGMHLITMSMVHEHKHTKASEPHLRTVVLLKFKDGIGTGIIDRGLLDMSMSDYESLPTVAQVLEARRGTDAGI
jgi:hypothetical protein